MDIFILAFEKADKNSDPIFMGLMFHGMYEAAKQYLTNEVKALKLLAGRRGNG